MELFAFWKYDIFPYVLGGEVIKFEGERVEVKGYEGCTFQPIKIMDIYTGKRIYEELNILKEEYDTKLKIFNNKFKSKAESILENNKG